MKHAEEYRLTQKRHIQIIGEIDEQTTIQVLEQLEYLQSTSQPILITLQTTGGCAYSAFAISDAIRRSPNHITTIATGCCMSAGTIISTSADVRAATKNCRFMVHEVSTSAYNEKYSDLENNLEETSALQTMMQEHYKRFTRSTLRVVKKWMSKDTYFSSDEALDVGLIDEVLQ